MDRDRLIALARRVRWHNVARAGALAALAALLGFWALAPAPQPAVPPAAAVPLFSQAVPPARPAVPVPPRRTRREQRRTTPRHRRRRAARPHPAPRPPRHRRVGVAPPVPVVRATVVPPRPAAQVPAPVPPPRPAPAEFRPGGREW